MLVVTAPLPQHNADPSVWIPQEWLAPLESVVKLLFGVALDTDEFPQHVTEPLFSSAQIW